MRTTTQRRTAIQGMLACSAMLQLCVGTTARADLRTWTGGGANGNWATSENWDVAPTSTDDVHIGTGFSSGHVSIGGTEGAPIVVNSLSLQNSTTADRNIGQTGFLQITSGSITRDASSTRTVVLNPTKLFLPAGTSTWNLNGGGVFMGAHIAPIGGSGAQTIVKTGVAAFRFYRENLEYAGDWDMEGDFDCERTYGLGSGKLTWRRRAASAQAVFGLRGHRYQVITNDIDMVSPLSNYFFMPYEASGQTGVFSGTLSGPASGSFGTLFFNTQGGVYAQNGVIVLAGTNTITGNPTLSVAAGQVRLTTPGYLAPVVSVSLGRTGNFSGNLIWEVAETVASKFSTRNSTNNFSQLTMGVPGTTTLTGQYSLSESSAEGANLRLSAVDGGTLVLSGLITDRKNINGVTLVTPTDRTITKVDAGSVVLSNNANEYQGGTIVDAGILRVENTSGSATGTGAVTVNDSGTLGGTGRISGAITVNDGGTLAPAVATAQATLTAAGNVTLAAGATYQARLAANGSDLLVVGGTLAIDPAALLTVDTTAYQGSVSMVKLIDCTARTTAFNPANISVTGSGSVRQDLDLHVWLHFPRGTVIAVR